MVREVSMPQIIGEWRYTTLIQCGGETVCRLPGDRATWRGERRYQLATWFVR